MAIRLRSLRQRIAIHVAPNGKLSCTMPGDKKPRAKRAKGMSPTGLARAAATARAVDAPRMAFTLPLPPSVNDVYRAVPYQTKGGRWEARILMNKLGRDYKTLAGSVATVQGVRPMLGELAVQYVFYRPRKAGDIDNYLKVLKDALNLVAWVDDSQVQEVVMRRDDTQPTNPRVEIVITRL